MAEHIKFIDRLTYAFGTIAAMLLISLVTYHVFN